MSDSLDINTIKIETEATKKSLEIRRDRIPKMCQRISMSVSALLNYCNRVLFLCNKIEEYKSESTEFTKECKRKVLAHENDPELCWTDTDDKLRESCKIIDCLTNENTKFETELKKVKRMLEQ